MKLSFQKFNSFLVKHPEYNDEKIFSCLFQNIHTVIVDPIFLFNKINYPLPKAFRFIKLLAEENIVKLNYPGMLCPNCGKYNSDFSSFICENCKLNIPYDNSISFTLDGIQDSAQTEIQRRQQIRKQNLINFLNDWSKNGFIYYISIDLSKSELFQRLGDGFYNNVLGTLRKIIMKFSVSNLLSNFFFFGEIGDCFKIAFSVKDDVLIFCDNLAKELKNHLYLFQDEQFPHLKIVGGKLLLPIDAKPETVVSETISGSIDINTKELTELFRKESELKLNYEKASENSNFVCFWITDGFIDDLEINKNIKPYEFAFGKHVNGVEKTRAKAILITYPDGVRTIEMEPESFIDKAL